MGNKPKKKEKTKWSSPSITIINFKDSEGKFGTFGEATDMQGNMIGS